MRGDSVATGFVAGCFSPPFVRPPTSGESPACLARGTWNGSTSSAGGGEIAISSLAQLLTLAGRLGEEGGFGAAFRGAAVGVAVFSEITGAGGGGVSREGFAVASMTEDVGAGLISARTLGVLRIQSR